MHLQCEETVPNDVSHGLIPKDLRKLRFNPGFYTSVNLELPFSVQSRYKLRPSLHCEVCNTMRGACHCTWVSRHPGPHWMLRIPGAGQSLNIRPLDVFLPTAASLPPLTDQVMKLSPQVTFATETHPSSDSSFLCRDLKRVGTYRAIPQLPLCSPRILTPTPQSLRPMAQKMVLPQEELCGQQCLR